MARFGANLVIVADQSTRNKALCPSFKHLDFESLNELEYCVLEAIAKSRYDGSTTIGDDGLVQKFNLVPKQLHYILVNLESNNLIKRQTVVSEKKRSLVHLARFAFKRKNILESLCDYLLARGHSYEECCDTLANARQNLGLTQKKFKNVIANAEKSNMVVEFLLS